MALFKIEKGLAANLSKNRPNTVEGYCYVTTDNGKMYIDIQRGTGTANNPAYRMVLNAGHADTAAALTTNAGSATQPVYFANGKPVNTTYTLGASVPSNAKFTDTTYSNATTSAAGLMSAADKTKLDAVASTYAKQATTITAGNGLTGGGSLAADRTLAVGAGTGISVTADAVSLATSGVAAGTYGPSANVSGSNGATISVPEIVVDTYGRVTKVTNRTYTSVNTDTLVTQTAVTTNGEFPLLLRGTSAGTTTTTAATSFGTGITANPSTGYITVPVGLKGTSTFTLNSASTVYMDRGSSVSYIFRRANSSGGWTEDCRFDTAGHFVPGTTNTLNIGSSSKKWRNMYATTFHGALSGNATTATTLQNTRTINGTNFNGSANIETSYWGAARLLQVGYKQLSIKGNANATWDLHDILFNTNSIGTASSWNVLNSGVYSVASDGAFTGTGNPESANGGLVPYRYGQLIVSRAGTTGLAQFYISHNDSNTSQKIGIKYRTGWNNAYVNTWETILDTSNFNEYAPTKTGTGASGTWGINITGNAATATALGSNAGSTTKPVYFSGGKPVACGTSLAVSITGNAATATKLATARTISLTGAVTGSVSFNGSANVSLATTVNHTHSYLPLSGGNMTGNINRTTYKGGNWVAGRDHAAIRTSSSVSTSSFAPIVSAKTQLGSWDLGPCHPSEYFYFSYATDANYTAGTNTSNSVVHLRNNGTLYGAVWNDYAEYRNQKEEIKPGYCVASSNSGKVHKTTEMYQACDGITSDTFGFAIGETDDCKTPLAVAGRVLAYCAGDRYDYNAGDTVCAGPGGLVYKMTREEIREWPDRIIGIVSEIPDYETWGTGNVEVNNRIWIKIK